MQLHGSGFAFAEITVGGIEMVIVPSCPVPFKWKCVPIPFNRKWELNRKMSFYKKKFPMCCISSSMVITCIYTTILRSDKVRHIQA